MSEYINPREAALMLGVSHETLRFWRYTGKFHDKIPHKKHISRRIFYKRTDVE
ncbi:helix-turn-helix domain-containing protein [Pseudomonas sp. LS-2]|uniref:helix-turn-helix domain-containing protein n=1 Tax=Pseudomonas sp. LS-2 TaxID=2315859 RepID=UPI000E77211F|nr:helix-turn-helix domain-containing protein [Pseudomonas sp. LS-2]RJX74028.1 DNA-binding protein [Pseudomonas sp. LS-2]